MARGLQRQPNTPGIVTALRRPPVRQSTLVRSGVRHTFPSTVRRSSARGGRAESAPRPAQDRPAQDEIFEQRQGGKVFQQPGRTAPRSTWGERRCRGSYPRDLS